MKYCKLPVVMKPKELTVHMNDLNDLMAVVKMIRMIQEAGVLQLWRGGGTPWSESASELYRPSDSRLSAK
jgi:hypothetical protein